MTRIVRTGAFDHICGRMMVALVLLVTAPGIGWSASGRAVSAICDQAAVVVAEETGVPLDVLRALTRTETGRGKRSDPWPWTVNMEGKGVWFDGKDDAMAYVFRHFKRGARSFDVGCFQINYKWHGQAFDSIEQMFEPLPNARYAAKFLTQMYRETGNWTDAAGAYHSKTPSYAKKYRARFTKIKGGLGPKPETQLAGRSAGGAAPVLPSARRKKPAFAYPLMVAGQGGGALGSLVPTGGNAARGSLFTTRRPTDAEG